jgi:hypothetical protein
MARLTSWPFPKPWTYPGLASSVSNNRHHTCLGTWKATYNSCPWGPESAHCIYNIFSGSFTSMEGILLHTCQHRRCEGNNPHWLLA